MDQALVAFVKEMLSSPFRKASLKLLELKQYNCYSRQNGVSVVRSKIVSL